MHPLRDRAATLTDCCTCSLSRPLRREARDFIRAAGCLLKRSAIDRCWGRVPRVLLVSRGCMLGSSCEARGARVQAAARDAAHVQGSTSASWGRMRLALLASNRGITSCVVYAQRILRCLCAAATGYCRRRDCGGALAGQCVGLPVAAVAAGASAGRSSPRRRSQACERPRARVSPDFGKVAGAAACEPSIAAVCRLSLSRMRAR